jgi:hypothetical protein
LVTKAGIFDEPQEIVYQNLYDPKANDQLQSIKAFLVNQSRNYKKLILKHAKDGIIAGVEFQPWKFILLIILILFNNKKAYY